MILRLALYDTLIVIHCKKFLISTNIFTLPIGDWDGWKYLVHLSDFVLLFERVPLIHNFFNLFFIFSDKKILGGGGEGGAQTLYLLKFTTILLWFATLKHFDVIFVTVSIMPHLYSPKGEEVFLNWLAACVLLTSSASYNSVHGPDYFLFCTICGKAKKKQKCQKNKESYSQT